MKFVLASLLALLLTSCGTLPPPGAGPGPGYAGQYPPPGAYPVQPASCHARGNDVCAGCSVSCAAGKQASCTEGEVHQTSGFSPVCWTQSKCECN